MGCHRAYLLSHSQPRRTVLHYWLVEGDAYYVILVSSKKKKTYCAALDSFEHDILLYSVTVLVTFEYLGLKSLHPLKIF